MANTSTGLQLRSIVKKDVTLEISLVSVPTPEPKPEEVIVRVDASPINPSDQGLLFGGADLSTAKASGTPDRPVVTATVPPAALKAVGGRLDQSLPVGNEGAGVVVRAGTTPAAQALMQDGGDSRRLHVHSVPLHQGRAVPGPASRHHGRRGRLLLRQSAHGVGHGRHHAH